MRSARCKRCSVFIHKHEPIYLLNASIMSMISAFGNVLERARARLRGTAQGLSETVRFFFDGTTASARTFTTFELAFSGWSYSCITRRGRELGKKRFIAYRKTAQNQKEELPLEHWASRLLSQPNRLNTRSQLFRLIEEWFVYAGNAFLYAPCNGAKVPVQLWVLPADRVQVVLSDDPMNLVAGYVYRSARGNFAIREEDIIHFQSLHPGAHERDMVIGRGDIAAAIDNLTMSAMQREALRKKIVTQNIPPMFLKTRGNITDEQWQNFKQRIQQNVPDLMLVAALHFEGELVPLTNAGTERSYTEKALNTEGISETQIEELTAILGVPSGLITGKFQNRATSESLKAFFYENTVEPQADYFAEELTRHFSRFDNSIIIDHDKYVYQDPELLLKKQAQELQWGITTINEERAKVGLEPISGGGTPFVPSGFVPLSAALQQTVSQQGASQQGASQGTLLSPAPNKMYTEKHLLSPLKRTPFKRTSAAKEKNDEEPDPFGKEEYCTTFWKSYDGLADEATTLITRALQAEFDALEEEVLSNLDDALEKAHPTVLKKDNAGTTKLFDVAIWKERFASSVSTDLEALLTRSMEQAAKDVGEEWDDIKSQFDASIRAALRESTDRIKTSVDTVKTELQQLLEDMYDKPVEEIQAAMMAKFSHYTAARALMIARTYSTFAMTFAQMTVWKDLGYTYTWLSQRDGKTRDTHKVADMQEPDKEGYFKVGTDRMKHPGGGSQAKENVHCRCVLRPKKK